jgi:hypothetical protein
MKLILNLCLAKVQHIGLCNTICMVHNQMIAQMHVISDIEFKPHLYIFQALHLGYIEVSLYLVASTN